jgi:Bacterial RNA polymerase, alpha chain C terminal domain
MNPGEFILLIIFVPFVVSILANELTGWFPWLAEKVLEYWVRKLPKQGRQRWLDEWLGELDTIPGGVFKLWFACCHGIGIKALKREELRKAIQILNDDDIEKDELQEKPQRVIFSNATFTMGKVTLEGLGLSKRLVELLREGNIDSVDKLISLSAKDLIELPYVGEQSIHEIQRQLAMYSLELKE